MHRFFPNRTVAAIALASLGLATLAPAPQTAFAAPMVVQDETTLVSEARALVKEGKFAEALPKFSAAIAKRPDYASAYADRAGCYFNLKRYPEALKDFAKLIELKPAAPEGYFNRGLVLLTSRTATSSRRPPISRRSSNSSPAPAKAKTCCLKPTTSAPTATSRSRTGKTQSPTAGK